MDQNERQVIDELFGKLRQLDQQAPQRDAEAEAHIRQQVAAMPAAPYYMAQAILVQEQALANLQSRVQELEQRGRRAAGGGGFLGGLFGGGAAGGPAPRRRRRRRGRSRSNTCSPAQAAPGSPWGRPAGGGFLAGAMQTALGVAGGMLIADALTSAFDSGTAEAGELAQDAGLVDEPGHEPMRRHEEPAFDDGGDTGGDDGFERVARGRADSRRRPRL